MCVRELAPFPCAAVLHVGHGVDGNELRIRADEDELAAACPPAAGRAFLVGDGDLVHGNFLNL